MVKVIFLDSCYRKFFSNRSLNQKNFVQRKTELKNFLFRSLHRIRNSPVFQERALYIDFVQYSKLFLSQPPQVRFPTSRSPSKIDGPNVPKKTFEFHFFSELKNLFSQITSFITCNWVGIENFPDVENFSMGELSIYVPCIRVLKVRKLQQCYL